MRIGLVLQPFSEQSLRLAAQIGATDIVAGMPDGDFDELIRLKSRVEDAGLSLSVLEGLMGIDEVVLGNESRDARIEAFQDGLRKMGAGGVPTLCYNFMVWRPGVGVVRTSYTTRERGGSWVSSFDAGLLAHAPPYPWSHHRGGARLGPSRALPQGCDPRRRRCGRQAGHAPRRPAHVAARPGTDHEYPR
jgi:D-mannonate dehydratase